jgi:hypothetical protein
MITTVTVVYKPELALLKTQAQSFDRYLKDVEDILVVVNDNSALDIDVAWWGKHQSRVSVLSRTDIGYRDNVTINGRESQQLCKLLAPLRSDAKWSLWFDAKTFLIRELDPSGLFENNKFITNQMPVFDQFSEGFDVCKKLLNFGQQDSMWIAPGGMPYPVNTEILHTLVKYVKVTTGMSLVDWFEKYSQHPHFVTEMILYSQFARPLFTLYYTDTEPAYKCANLADWQIPDIEKFWQMLRDPGVLTASIKADAYELLSNEQLQQWHQYLESKGLEYDHKSR